MDALVFFSHPPEELASFGLQLDVPDRCSQFHMLTSPGRHDLRVVVEMYRDGAMVPVVEVVGHSDDQGELRLEVRRL